MWLLKYEFKITPAFARDFKRLAKKNKHLADDFDHFLQRFVHTQSDITLVGVRMSATGTGKRGGYRIIYYFFHENKIYFLKIYQKAIQETISESEKKQIQKLIEEIRNMN